MNTISALELESAYTTPRQMHSSVFVLKGFLDPTVQQRCWIFVVDVAMDIVIGKPPSASVSKAALVNIAKSMFEKKTLAVPLGSVAEMDTATREPPSVSVQPQLPTNSIATTLPIQPSVPDTMALFAAMLECATISMNALAMMDTLDRRASMPLVSLDATMEHARSPKESFRASAEKDGLVTTAMYRALRRATLSAAPMNAIATESAESALVNALTDFQDRLVRPK